MDDKTAKILDEMLKENTGRALLDSGDYYGRHWQRNQGRDFEKEPVSRLRFDVYGERVEMGVTHSVYHWLKDRLSYREDLDSLFVAFAGRPENEDKAWLQLAEEFVNDYLPAPCPDHDDDDRECSACQGLRGVDVGGIYGDGEPVTVNTYNGDDLLSQTIQYVFFTIEGLGAFVMLQVHGGCDARGGYTRPRAFEVTGGSDETAVFDNARATISCDGQSIFRYTCANGHKWTTPTSTQTEVCPECLGDVVKHYEDTEHHYWDTEDGYHFEDQSYPGPRYDLLGDVFVLRNDDDREVKDVWKPGLTVVEEDTKTGYCPHCGGKLEAGY